jgi:hypothetical protein
MDVWEEEKMSVIGKEQSVLLLLLSVLRSAPAKPPYTTTTSSSSNSRKAAGESIVGETMGWGKMVKKKGKPSKNTARKPTFS